MAHDRPGSELASADEQPRPECAPGDSQEIVGIVVFHDVDESVKGYGLERMVVVYIQDNIV
jgi:hypothetical protein